MLTLTNFDFSHVVTLAVGIIGTLVTAYVTRKKDKRVDMQQEFELLTKANASFREEVRKDLLAAKKELEKAREELAAAKKRIETLEGELATRENRVKQLETEVAGLKEQLSVYMGTSHS